MQEGGKCWRKLLKSEVEVLMVGARGRPKREVEVCRGVGDARTRYMCWVRCWG